MTNHLSSAPISPEMLAQIEESPLAHKPLLKPQKTSPALPPTSSQSSETMSPILMAMLGVLAMAAGVLTVLVIANYARLH